MGLRQRFGALAVARPHVMVVAPPASLRARVAVEHEVLRRGWVLGLSPADADILAVCGSDASTAFTTATERVWEAMPGPRARTQVGDVGEAGPALDRAVADLGDDAEQLEDSRRRTGRAETDHADSDHGDMSDDDMDDMEMSPAGIALAGGSEEDRDGLEMDVLHLPLGPVLPYWPSALVLSCELHGDAVAAAEAQLLGEPAVAPATTGSPTMPQALRCDALADVLALAGWPAGHHLAREARDELVLGSVSEAQQTLRRLGQRLERQVLLRWMLRDLGRLEVPDVPGSEGSAGAGALAGDVMDRTRRLVADAAGARTDPSALPALTDEELTGLVEGMVTGLDLATARLVVASLDVPSLLAAREVSRA